MGSKTWVATTVIRGRSVSFIPKQGSEKQKRESGRLNQHINYYIIRGNV